MQTSRMLLEAGICLAKGDCSPFCVKVTLAALLTDAWDRVRLLAFLPV